MTPTVSQVHSWVPGSLRTTCDQIGPIVRRLDGQRTGILAEQDALADTWRGVAAIAAAERIVSECARLGAVASAFENLASAYGTAAGHVEAAKSHVDFLVSAARNSGFEVSDVGVVDATAVISRIPADLGPTRGYEVAQILSVAADLTADISGALLEADLSAAAAIAAVELVAVTLEQLAVSSPSGHFVESSDGDFSWQPDWPATTAAAVIGTMAGETGKALSTAAVASLDDVARNIGRGFGPFGAALGAIPAISNDIHDGMDPTKAVVTESAGAAVGLATGAVAGEWVGAAIGTALFPGAGTIAGVVVGAAVGGFFSWGVSKTTQLAW